MSQNLDFRRSHQISFFFFSSLLFLSFVLPSSGYILPDRFFINCGSDSNVTIGNRKFIGDDVSGDSVSFSKRSSSEVESKSQSASDTSPIYQSARVFRRRSSYKFDLASIGTYVVRFHFSALSSSTDLLSARFDVSASGFSLLTDFSIRNSPNTTEVKEFLMTVSEGSFEISFSPQTASLAFVNAIEAFPAPENFIRDEATHVGAGNPTFSGLNSKILHPVYRLNVGGAKIVPENDTLWRNWSLDDDYLFSPDTARNSKPLSQRPDYLGLATEFIAPDPVYQTAKEMNISSDPRAFNNFNMTWSFNVTKNILHFVRVHFCDILSPSVDANYMFNLYIDARLRQEINLYDITRSTAAPAFFDFVVDLEDSGVLKISIGPSNKPESTKRPAILNGLEIMQILGESSSSSSAGGDKKKIFIIAGSILGALALISVVALFVFLRRKKPKPGGENSVRSTPVESTKTQVFEEGTNNSPYRNLVSLELKIPFSEILKATNNFDEEFLIGKGGFGNVYKGILEDGTKVAVKRSKPESRQGFSEFQTEIHVLSKIRHRHLVSLIGYCDENFEMILVYEFMENGTLQEHLYGSNFPSLSWKQRLEICIGAAKGLDYLHSGSANGIIHRDVKSTNILLDANHVGKVADFGLSKFSPPPGQSQASFTGVKGTVGYLDPEYYQCNILTEKSDVYSYGVVLLEVLCARPAVLKNVTNEREANLADWGMFCKDKGTVEEIVDPVLVGRVNPNSLRKFLEIVEKCLKENSEDRPRMADVLWDLQYALQLQQSAVRGSPHDDSAATVDESLVLRSINVHDSFSSELNMMAATAAEEDISSSSASRVFSQIKISEAR